MKKSICFIFIVLFMIFNINVHASSGKLRSASIKSCNGVMYGQHSSDNHWHVAEKQEEGYYPIGDAIYSDPCASSVNNNNNSDNNSSTNNTTTTTTKNVSTTQTTIKEQTTTKKKTTNTITKKPRNSDNTLKEIIIDNNIMEVKDIISYETQNEKVDIKVVTNDEKASFEIKNNNNLSIGKNEIVIEVKAEDGTIKNYIINITRKLILSSNTGIKIIINDTEVIFDNYKATIYVNNSDTNIDFDYELEDEKSKIEYDEIEELKVGDNNLEIKVIAEDGSEQIYNIVINRATKTEDAISTILGLGIVGGSGYGVYKLVKKRKKNIK